MILYNDTLLKYLSRTGYSCVGDNGEGVEAGWDDYDADPDWNVFDQGGWSSVQLKSFYGYQTGCGMGLGWRANGMKTYCAFNTSAADPSPISVTLKIKCNIFVDETAPNPTIRVYYHDFGEALDSNDWVGGTLSGSQLVSPGNDQTIEITLNISHVNIGAISRYRISLDKIEDGAEPDIYKGWYIKVTDLELKLGYEEEQPPSASTELLCNGQTNPTELEILTPYFSAIYNDPDVADIAKHYQIQVNEKADFTGRMPWDSGKTPMADVNQGERPEDINYGGSALARDLTYWWRIKFWDDEDNEGAWSDEEAYFKGKPQVFVGFIG